MRSKIRALGAKLLPKNLYSRLTLTTTVTIIAGYFVVYAWTTLDPVDAGPTKTLTATLMQGIVNNINDLNTRVSNFGFSAGKVGIGTASPLRKLHVSGDWIIVDNTYGLLGLNTTGGQKIIAQMRNDNNYGFGESALVITDGGNVGIGTASPGGKLNIVQTVDAPSLKIFSNQTGYLSSNQSVLSITTTNGTSNPTTSYAVTATYNGSNILHVRNDGKVGIGTASPGEKLEVYGNIRFGAIDSARQITIWTATIPSPTTCDATCVNSYCLGAYIDGTTTKATCSSTTSNRNCVCIGK